MSLDPLIFNVSLIIHLNYVLLFLENKKIRLFCSFQRPKMTLLKEKDYAVKQIWFLSKNSFILKNSLYHAH